MLPEHLIVNFWFEVVNDCVRRHHLTAPDATAAVQTYRHLIDARGVNYMVYHRNSEDVADTVAAGWKSGFLKRPTPARTP